jgi:hypothetical protein
MNQTEQQKRKWPWLIYYGFMVALVSGALMAGKYIVGQIEFVLPFTIGLGVLMILLGYYGEIKRKQGKQEGD